MTDGLARTPAPRRGLASCERHATGVTRHPVRRPFGRSPRHGWRRIGSVLLILATTQAARAETLVVLRPHAVVEEAVLRLGELFDGLDAARAARPVAAAPLPGRRLLLETAQLAALARAHQLAWRPLSTRDQAVVERPGRPLGRAEIEAALRAELVPLGLDPEAALELGGLLPPLVPVAAPVSLAAEGATFDAAGGRFAATLVVAAEGMPVLRQRLAGRAVATVPAVLATRRLVLGEILRAGDVRVIRLRAELARGVMAETPEQVLGKQVRRPMAADAPVLLTDLAPPAEVDRHGLVTLLLEAPGLQLSAQGRALEAAPRGATVRVVNLMSQTVVEGVVIAPGRVRVALGSGPVAATPAVAARRH
jgi:flagella basal body P-ring formation protein FlgA